MKHISLALQNIKRYKSRKKTEHIKQVGYMFLEAITALAIFAFGYLWFLLVNK